MPFLKTEEHTDKQQDRIYTISDILNSSNVWRMLEVRLGIKLDTTDENTDTSDTEPTKDENRLTH